MTVTFTVPGDPVPQPRPRVSTAGGFARAYVPKGHAIHGYRQAVAIAARAAGLQDVFGDDTMVSRLVVEKSWGTEGRTTVRVS
jgi:Holliday junction resolvase RusA-like endonuclease